MASYNIDSLAAVDSLVDLGEVADDVVDVLDAWTGAPKDARSALALMRGAQVLRSIADLREGHLAAADAFVQLDSLNYVGSFGSKDSIQSRMAFHASPDSHSSLSELATSADALAKGEGSVKLIPVLIAIFDQLADATIVIARTTGRATLERDSWTTATSS